MFQLSNLKELNDRAMWKHLRNNLEIMTIYLYIYKLKRREVF